MFGNDRARQCVGFNVTRFLLAAAALAIAAPAAATTFTGTQLAAAAEGLQALRELNLTVLGNLTAGAEVEGKTFVGGGVSGNAENFGIGSNANPNEGFTQNNARATLTIGGTNGGGVTLNNGANGKSGTVSGNVKQTLTDSRVDIGGDSTGTVAGNISGVTVRAGGSFNNQNYNPSATKTATYGTTASNLQAQDTAYVTQDTSLADGKTGLAKVIASQTSALLADFTTLSDVLASLATNATLNTSDTNNIHFDYGSSAKSDAYVVATVAASDLFGKTGMLNLSLLSDLTTATGYKTTVINVVGEVAKGSYAYTLNNNDNQASNDQNVIWNFISASGSAVSLALNAAFHGSVLAPNATVSNGTAVNGSVVAGNFVQGGEVHLGTYQGTSALVLALPEPANWMTMIVGFGMIGATMRRTASPARKRKA